MPSDWEDNDIEESVVVAVPAANKKEWEDEDEDESNIKDSWDASDPEEEEKPAAPPPKKTAAQKYAERKEEEKKKNELAEKKRLDKAQAEGEDAETRKQRLRELELEADMANTTDLFSGVKVKDEDSKPLNQMTPKNKEQFDEFQTALIEVIGRHQNQGFYPTFLENLIRELAQPLSDIHVRKYSSMLTALANEKQKISREQNTPKKKKGVSKPVLGGGGLKSATKGDIDFDGTVYDNGDDYDDFM